MKSNLIFAVIVAFALPCGSQLLAQGPSKPAPQSGAVTSPSGATQVSAANITKKVLVLNIDPVLENQGGQRLNAYMKWRDTRKLNAEYLADLTEASGGYVQWNVAAWVDLDLWPKKKDGFHYDDVTYIQCWKDKNAHPFHEADAVDYDAILDMPLEVLQNQTPHQLAASGFADEIVVWAHPYSGFYESQMVGKTAYWCNSGPIIRPSRLYVVMCLNPEREVALALHSFGHRAESIMTKVYGSWSGTASVKHLWDRFTRVGPKQGVGVAGCGNIHFPPNASKDYAYDVATPFNSEANLWLNFPSLSGTPQMVNSTAWGGPDFQLGFMRWWFSHLPKAPGRYSDPKNRLNDGKLNNWWAYIVDMNAYAESR